MSARTSSLSTIAAAALLAGAGIASGVAAAAPRDPGRAMRAPVVCDGAVQHPLQVRAVALDPVRRGAVVRVRVSVTSRKPLERGEARLVSTGGATLVSAARTPLGRLDAAQAASADFAVRLPDQGQRFLLQFQVSGDGGRGVDARGATLNLLPDGPADPGRAVAAAGGGSVVEYRARRIP